MRSGGRDGRRRALRLAGTSCLLVAAAIAFLPAGSAAQEPVVVGWWHRDVPLSGEAQTAATMRAQAGAGSAVVMLPAGPVGSSQVPPPPQLPPAPLPTTPPDVVVPDPGTDVPTPSPAPDGGLLVAGDVTGPRAMAALRFDAPDAGSAVLTLTVATGSSPSPGIQACPALSDWLPGADQPWAHRPAHDCDRVSTSSTLSPDGATMEWILPETFKPLDSPHYDVVLLPLGGDGTPFQVAFEPPGPEAFTVTSPAPTFDPPDLDPLPEDLPPSIDAFSPDGFDLDGLTAPSFGGAPEHTVTIQPAGQRSAAGGGPLEDLARALENPTTRRLATLALVLVGAYAYWQSGQSAQRMPQLLGALRGPGGVSRPARPLPSGGIGRFARPRTRPPMRL